MGKPSCLCVQLQVLKNFFMLENFLICSLRSMAHLHIFFSSSISNAMLQELVSLRACKILWSTSLRERFMRLMMENHMLNQFKLLCVGQQAKTSRQGLSRTFKPLQKLQTQLTVASSRLVVCAHLKSPLMGLCLHQMSNSNLFGVHQYLNLWETPQCWKMPVGHL